MSPSRRNEVSTLAEWASFGSPSESPSARLRLLLGPRFAVATALPVMAEESLFPEERCYVAPAAVARKAQFGTVRVCARRALAQLGVPPCVLVPQPDGSPRWPFGVVGSMSHTKLLCAAAVTKDLNVLAAGIDVELDTPLDEDLEELVCTVSERSWIQRQDPQLIGKLGKVFFSAKEALYKCHFPITRTTPEFTDFDLNVDIARQVFWVNKVRSPPNSDFPWRAVRGGFGTSAGHLLSVAVVD